ncbi:MAG: glycoside hydrolase family 3 N-terminal domain-containing protein [Planctomycetota bacterium]
MTDDPGQLLLVGIPGPTLDADTAALLRRVQPGGYILFGRNIQAPEQLRRLIDDLRDLSTVEPVITVDQEGGRVSRLRLIGEEPPSAQQLRNRSDEQLVRRHGDLTARLLRLFGFNLDLCPVLDISFDDEADNSLRGRCYGRTAAEVTALAGAFNAALRAGGILSCGKHFPGYSMAGQDPHHGFPSVARSRAELEANELAVFRHFVPLVDSMMMGHVHYAALEATVRPASLSPAMIDGLLRRELGFDGLVMTDDLDMGAILEAGSFDDTLALALAAGNDLLMICHRVELFEQARRVLEGQPRPLVEAALARVRAFKGRMQPPAAWSQAAFDALTLETWDLRVAVLGPERAEQRSTETGSRSPVERY